MIRGSPLPESPPNLCVQLSWASAGYPLQGRWLESRVPHHGVFWGVSQPDGEGPGPEGSEGVR